MSGVHEIRVRANGNCAIDCVLMNPAGQDFRPTGGDNCGPWNTLAFGDRTKQRS